MKDPSENSLRKLIEDLADQAYKREGMSSEEEHLYDDLMDMLIGEALREQKQKPSK